MSPCFQFFWVVELITGSYSNSVFNFVVVVVFHSGWTTLYSHQQCTSVPFFHTLTKTCYFLFSLLFLLAILMDGKWYLIAVLVCICLMRWICAFGLHLPNIFSCAYFSICMSSLEKYLFRSFAHFLIGLFVFLLLCCKNSSEYKSLISIWFRNIFPIVWVSFHFLYSVLWSTNAF